MEPSESRPDWQSRHYSEWFEDFEDRDKMPFSNYITGVQFPKGFKSPSDLEPYDGSTAKEHMDAFKSRMALARLSDPVKC